jgi:hypothetical protein
MRRIFEKELRRLMSKFLLVMVLGSSGLASCTYYTNEFDPAEAPDDVSFSADIVPIFEASCNAAGCHNGTIPPDLQPDAAYANIIGLGYVVPGTPAEDNSFYQVIDGGSMTVYATNLERSYIKKWIDEGALDN